ncbi:putative protein kinase CMGC-DYRK-PRP4 family [Helianthus annuus]|nr:putative protein kinase CMGC-DYRK-PRP4 family [Helianthus annuus]KAJ0639992.1 putative protein kinase CMGC-DYRK-PRP4 family [Helianthus annuus]KAJ0643951.1 putative protein kinase CMGC-DYRK-PRP4 family [Helianthus annuus]KAJ0820164.1 putative protein kinase CMGC-DYRK-PRP4 family [Helianthus annuus]
MRDRERERERERGRRDRERGVDSKRENNRNRRCYNYNDGDRDRSNDYKHHRHEETDYRDKLRKYDRQKDDSSKAVNADAEKIKREEVDEEAYQDKSALQVEEDDEEEDLNRIKEESGRRIQAILEKYKTKPMQQQQQPLPPQLVEEGAANVNSRDLDGEGEGSDTNIGDTPFSVGRSAPQNGNSGVQRASGAGGLGEGTPKSERSNADDIFGESTPRAREMNERSNDMFSDDIFGESPAGVRISGKGDGLTVQRSGLQDNWDDRCKAGLEELVILKKLVGADLEDMRYCIRFLSSFKYRNHLCLVFESLHVNLREVLKKFGRNIGLKLTVVRAYGKKLFIALKHLRNCGVLHTDIKLDNMLVNDAKNVLKLCDFGNAMFAGKNEITPYLVSRFYRAPEISKHYNYDNLS